jgi:hypothetical protein
MIDSFEMFVLNERIYFLFFYFLFLPKHIVREVAIFLPLKCGAEDAMFQVTQRCLIKEQKLVTKKSTFHSHIFLSYISSLISKIYYLTSSYPKSSSLKSHISTYNPLFTSSFLLSIPQLKNMPKKKNCGACGPTSALVKLLFTSLIRLL